MNEQRSSSEKIALMQELESRLKIEFENRVCRPSLKIRTPGEFEPGRAGGVCSDAWGSSDPEAAGPGPLRDCRPGLEPRRAALFQCSDAWEWSPRPRSYGWRGAWRSSLGEPEQESELEPESEPVPEPEPESESGSD